MDYRPPRAGIFLKMPKQPRNQKLTARQVAFLDDVFAHPADAQVDVYLRHYKAAKTTASTMASRVIRSTAGKAYLAKKQKAVQARAEHSEDEIIRGFAEIAFLDPLDVFNEHWDVKSLDDIPPHARRAISSITPIAGGMVKVTFHAKNDALKNLGTLLGMYQDKGGEDEGSMLKQLFDLVQKTSNTGRPGTLRFDMAIAARSKFDADE